MRLIHHAFRIYVTLERLPATIGFYESLQQRSCERRLSFPDVGIEVAVVGAFILLSGSEEALAPVRQVQATLTVDSLAGIENWLERSGARPLGTVRTTPTGRHLIAQHGDGLIAEYYEASESPADT